MSICELMCGVRRIALSSECVTPPSSNLKSCGHVPLRKPLRALSLLSLLELLCDKRELYSMMGRNEP